MRKGVATDSRGGPQPGGGVSCLYLSSSQRVLFFYSSAYHSSSSSSASSSSSSSYSHCHFSGPHSGKRRDAVCSRGKKAENVGQRSK